MTDEGMLAYNVQLVKMFAKADAENARLREALQDIFDYECQFSSTSLIACTAKDALAEKEKKP